MLIIFLLLGCVVVDNLAFDYEDFDDQYSYDDDDDDEEVMVFPGFESARVRRYDRDSVTRSQPDQKDIKGLLHQIMSGRKIEDFISDEPFTSKEETNQDNNDGSSTPARETYDIITPMTKDDRFSTINSEYDNLETPNIDVRLVNTNNYDNLDTLSTDIPPVYTNNYDNVKTPSNDIVPVNTDNYDNLDTPNKNIRPVITNNYDNLYTPNKNIRPVITNNYDNLYTSNKNIRPVITNNYDNLYTPNKNIRPVITNNYDNLDTPSNDIRGFNYDNLKTPSNDIVPVNTDNYNNLDTPNNDIRRFNTNHYDNLKTPSNDVRPVNTNNYDNIVTTSDNQIPGHTYNYDTVKFINDYDITPITKGEDRFTVTSTLSGNMMNEYYNVTPATKMPVRTTLEWIIQTENAMYKQELMSYMQEIADERAENELRKATRIATEYSYIVPERSSLKKALFYDQGLRDGEDGLGLNEPTTGNSTSNTTSANLTTITTTVTTTAKPTTRGFDIEKFLEVIANLTYDYDTNLTMEVNETLKKMSWPTCALPTIATTTTTTTELTTIPTDGPPDYAAINHTLIGKCFVCGLETEGIPYDANCADAFAGDFIPLVPQDPRAKGQIARFRKYCRYHDVDNYAKNKTMPRSVFGRWTGGCSVRWTDLSGVYTQRSCRNRFHATTGRHFASKRMAKLEMALSNLENGCIISPVATLLPLSRGISLFARFHACVCTGNWCNMAQRNSGLTAVIVTMLATVIITWLNEM